jgi:hypothetical protein
MTLALLLDVFRTDQLLSYPWQMRINGVVLYPLYAVLAGIVSLVYPTIGA